MPRQNQNRPRKKIILGVTGSFGSGKTTVAGILKSFGARIIDADRIAHGCIRPPEPAYKKIRAAFGKKILQKNGLIDRAKLAQVVFGDKKLLRKLNNAVHPQAIGIIKDKIRSFESGVVVLDAPLLLEAGLKNIVDKLIVVKVTQAEQLRRVKKKTSLSEAEILKRIKAQMSQNAKSGFANFIIDNSGTIQETRRQAGKIMKRLSLASDK